MVDGEEGSSNIGAQFSAVGDDDSLGGGRMDQDAEVASPFSTGERSPGGGLPSPPGADAPGGTLPKRSLRERFFAGRKPKDATSSAPKSNEKAPKAPRGKRVSGAETLADMWSGAGSFIVRNPAHIPLGRYMQFQAPVAGEMIDEAVKGSIVDTLALQKIVKGRARFDLIGAVFGPPAIIYAIERDPSRGEVLFPMLKASIRNALPLMVPAIKKVQKREAEMVQAAEELFDDDPNFAEWVRERQAQGQTPDPAEYIMGMIFGGWVPPSVVVDVPTTDVEVVVR